jgi:hypothetical protein
MPKPAANRKTKSVLVISHHSSGVHATMGQAHSRFLQVTGLALAKVGFTLAVLLPACATISAQVPAEAAPVAGATNLERQEGTDAGSGVHYVRLVLSLSEGPAQRDAPPRFTVECIDNKGKHDLRWLVSFGGVASSEFQPPFHATQTDLFPPQYPSVNLKMMFEGYTRSKPFNRSWTLLPSGELRYRNPGLDSSNMESARYFLQFLIALPDLRLSYAKPSKGTPREIFFQTQPLLDELKKSPICRP